MDAAPSGRGYRRGGARRSPSATSAPADACASDRHASSGVLDRWTRPDRGAPRRRRPTWIRDADRQIPSCRSPGTNGKSTVTRLITHILLRAGQHVGTTTSDGILVDERMVEPGDWTGPGGAPRSSHRDDVDIAVLETARGGILLRGVGYESNEASVITNVSSDHLDLQGIHTLPELAEVKATIAGSRSPTAGSSSTPTTRSSPASRAASGRHVAFFSMDPDARRLDRAATAGRAAARTSLRGGRLSSRGRRRARARSTSRTSRRAGRPRAPQRGERARRGRRRAGPGRDASSRSPTGLRDFRPSADLSPGRLNLFRLGEPHGDRRLRPQRGGHAARSSTSRPGSPGGAARPGGARSPRSSAPPATGPTTRSRGIGRIAAERAQRVVIKETLDYLRGRDARESSSARSSRASPRAAWTPRTCQIYDGEATALEAELDGWRRGARRRAGDGRRTRRDPVLPRGARRRLRAPRRLGARQVDVERA